MRSGTDRARSPRARTGQHVKSLSPDAAAVFTAWLKDTLVGDLEVLSRVTDTRSRIDGALSRSGAPVRLSSAIQEKAEVEDLRQGS